MAGKEEGTKLVCTECGSDWTSSSNPGTCGKCKKTTVAITVSK